MFVDFNILNQLGSPAINSNTFANRPAAGQTGRLFVSTDTFEIYRDNGTSWDLIGGPGAGTITGTGTATQVAYFTGSQTIGSSANLFWDNTAGALGINTATPGAELDVHGTGIMVQLNSTTATANSLLAFQRSGTGLWRIGDVYNGGTNYFEIFNTVLSTTGLRMNAATNKTEFLAQENYTTGQAQGNLFTYNLTVPGGTTFTSPNAIHSVNSYLNLSLGGNTTTPAGARQGLEGNSRISFTGAGTLTMTQGSTVRAWSSLSSVYSFNGSAVGTITHLAGLRVCFPDNTGSAVNITNNYGLLINNQTAGLGTVNYTNRWGIYQEGASDLNYFNGNLLVKTTTNAGFAADINGTVRVQGNLSISGSTSQISFGTSTGAGVNQFLLYDGGSTTTRSGFAIGNSNLNIFAFNSNGFNFGIGVDNSTITNANATFRITTAVATLRTDLSLTNNLLFTGSTSQISFGTSTGAGVNQFLLYDGGSTTTRSGFAIGNSNLNIFAFNGNGFNFGIGLDATTITNNNSIFRLANSGSILNSSLTITSGDVILGSTSGSTSVGATTTINASAQLQVVSTTKGFLPPVMTGAQAEAIATPAAGLLVYANNGNGVTITTTGWWGYDGATWVKLN
jgi:hypothetical protein